MLARQDSPQHDLAGAVISRSMGSGQYETTETDSKQIDYLIHSLATVVC